MWTIKHKTNKQKIILQEESIRKSTINTQNAAFRVKTDTMFRKRHLAADTGCM